MIAQCHVMHEDKQKDNKQIWREGTALSYTRALRVRRRENVVIFEGERGVCIHVVGLGEVPSLASAEERPAWKSLSKAMDQWSPI